MSAVESSGSKTMLEPGGEASRLIDWTGERCVPWAPDAGMIYEHLHRYLFAAALMHGRRVLDLASGEGYGADILARVAHTVVGLELDTEAVKHSSATYVRENLRFETGSMLELGRFSPASFDAVTCFEALEHILEHDQLLSEIDRVLAADGILVISTPDRHVHTEHMHQDNPFHVRELDAGELEALLRTRLDHVQLWGQRFGTGSLMAPIGLDPSGLSTFAVRKQGDAWEQVTETPPTYVIGVAGRKPLSLQPFVSWVNDEGHEVIKPTGHFLRETLGGDEARPPAHQLNTLEAVVDQLADQTAHTVNELQLAEDRIVGYEAHCLRLESELNAITSSKGWRAVLAARRAVNAVRAVAARRPNA